MNNEYLINEGCLRLLVATQPSNTPFERCDDEHDGVLSDDDDVLSFTTSIKVLPFSNDNGEVVPEPVTFQIDYNRHDSTYHFIVAEDTELSITYGNVMAFLYFSAIQSA